MEETDHREPIAFRGLKDHDGAYSVNIPKEVFEDYGFPEEGKLIVEYDRKTGEVVYRPA